jgi:hypothetical protein
MNDGVIRLPRPSGGEHLLGLIASWGHEEFAFGRVHGGFEELLRFISPSPL